jgi:predicted XRE-type DNA-binding protein
MKTRSALMMELSAAIQEHGMTQSEATEVFGVVQPRISDLVRGKINRFSLDTPMDLAATAGMAPTVKGTKLKAPVRKRLLNRPFLAA